MNRESAIVAEALNIPVKLADLRLETLHFVFDAIRKTPYSYSVLCSMILQAARRPDADDADIHFVAEWLKAHEKQS